MATATAVAPISDISSGGLAGKRKRSRSRSPAQPPLNRRRSLSPSSKVRLELPKVDDVDPVRKRERERQMALRLAENELEGNDKEKEKGKEKERPFDAQAEFAKLVSSRSGGVYVPPARLRAMQAEASKDKSSAEYQRLSWDALRKSITGIVNRVNVTNIKDIIPELFNENLIRGRGLFARSVMKAQAASLPFTPVFAALVAIINTKLPQVGELVLTRLISQFRRAFKRNDKIVCHSTTTFIAHLVNQSVAHEIIALQILVLLLERPTDDSIEIAVGFMREVGAYLAENSPKANASVYERFRAVLNEGAISQRVQYMIEVLMQVRKDKYKDNPILPEGLDLVLEEEQITHQIGLDDELQVQEGLNIFKLDPNYLENEEKYKEIKVEILGEDSEEDESGSDSDESNEEEAVEDKQGIEDQTSTDLVNLRRIIYLTIMNALNYEEAVHKLLKVQIDEGQEIELIKMVIECCSQERSYSKFYGLIGERFSKLNRVWTDALEQSFRDYYETIHRYETNRLRNIARFFGHIFSTDAISWSAFEVIKMNEDDTTSSSRIFVKIMLQEVVESMGLQTVAERFKDPEVKHFCEGMFPMDNPKNTRFSINYFTSIGMGAVTEEMREHLKNAPRLIMEQRRALLEQESSSSDSDSDTDSDPTTSSGDSDSEASEDSRRRSRSPPRRRRTPTLLRRDRDRPKDPPPHRGRDDSRTPPPRNGRDYRARSDSHSPSRSPPPARRAPARSRSRTPPRGRRANGRNANAREISPDVRDHDRSRERHWSPPSHGRDAPVYRRGAPGRDVIPERERERFRGEDQDHDRGFSRDADRDRDRDRARDAHPRSVNGRFGRSLSRSPPRKQERVDSRERYRGGRRARTPPKDDSPPPARRQRSLSSEPPRRYAREREDSRERYRDVDRRRR